MDVKCPRCKSRFEVQDTDVGQRGKCENCQFPFTYKAARPIWVLVTVPIALVLVALIAVLVFRSSSNTITILEKTETGETVKVVLHVDHSEYEAKTRKLFQTLQSMSSLADTASAANKRMGYKDFSDKFGDLADLTRDFGIAEKGLSDDEKRLGSWVFAAAAVSHFQASNPGKPSGETSGETKDNIGNTVLWNLRTAAGCWKVAAGFMKAGDELLVPLDCPLCEGEKVVDCPMCAGAKTVIDDTLGRSVPCKACGGTGKVKCPVCDGEGKIVH
jgi:predicted Zn finger-like uncharacterized protein